MKIVFQIRPVLKSHLFYSKIIALIRFNTCNNYPVWRDHAVSNLARLYAFHEFISRREREKGTATPRLMTHYAN